MKKTYEEACTLSRAMVTAERLTALGVTETMRLYVAQLEAEFGWTISELSEEARCRMCALIAHRRENEG